MLLNDTSLQPFSATLVALLLIVGFLTSVTGFFCFQRTRASKGMDDSVESMETDSMKTKGAKDSEDNDSTAPVATDVGMDRKWTQQKEVTVYSIKGCLGCIKAKKLLSAYHLRLNIVDLDKDPERISELEQKTKGDGSVPSIFFHDKYIGGFAQLKKLESDQKLESALLATVCTTSSSSSSSSSSTPSTSSASPTKFSSCSSCSSSTSTPSSSDASITSSPTPSTSKADDAESDLYQLSRKLKSELQDRLTTKKTKRKKVLRFSGSDVMTTLRRISVHGTIKVYHPLAHPYTHVPSPCITTRIHLKDSVI